MRNISLMSGISGLLAVLALALTLVAPVWAEEREYTTIAYPEARSTTAWGINDQGDVVGTFVDQNSVQHGFLLRNGEFTVIDFPGARSTIARGINLFGEIVGSYQLPGDPANAARGFRRTTRGRFVNVKFPGSLWEIAQRILPDGTIVGCRHDNDQMQSMRGITIGKYGTSVMLGRHGASEIDAFSSEIDAFGSMQNGATPDLRLFVGLWFNMMDNQPQGYMIENGVFTSFMAPGSNGTNAWDVNPDGAIVGVYRVGINTLRGFVKTGETYATIHYPKSTNTQAFGINARGDIVGNYVAGGVTRAFLARRVRKE